MTVRVVHWGTGYTGRFGLRGVIGSPKMELVGLVVERPENAGRDAGELCGEPDVGVISTSSIEDAISLAPDCVSYYGTGSGPGLDEGITNLLQLLEAGINVSSTVFTRFSHPQGVPEPYKSQIDEACAKGGSTFFSTGIEPGFASDVLPMAMLCAADRIDHINAAEIAKYGRYPKASMDLGTSFDEPPTVTDEFCMSLFGGTVLGIAEKVGVELEGLRPWQEYAPMPYDTTVAWGPIAKGSRGAIRCAVDGMYNGTPLITVMHVNYVFDEYPDEWQHSDAKGKTAYRTDLTGRPTGSLELTYPLGHAEYQAIVATAMRAITAIPFVVEAPPGHIGGLDVPLEHTGHVREF